MGIGGQTPPCGVRLRAGVSSPSQEQMCIWLHWGWLRSDPIPTDPRVYLATPPLLTVQNRAQVHRKATG
jgi:hypothetical protein